MLLRSEAGGPSGLPPVLAPWQFAPMPSRGYATVRKLYGYYNHQIYRGEKSVAKNLVTLQWSRNSTGT